MSDGEVTVHVAQETEATLCCPTCGEIAPGYDSRSRRWRYLDTCQYKTILVVEKGDGSKKGAEAFVFV